MVHLKYAVLVIGALRRVLRAIMLIRKNIPYVHHHSYPARSLGSGSG